MSKQTKKVDKYLTDIKELPPYEEKVDNDRRKLDKNMKNKEKTPPADKKENDHKETVNDADKTNQKKDGVFEKPKKLEDGSVGVKRKPLFSSKDIILGVINIISLILLVVLLVQFPKKAKELNNLRTERFKNESSLSFEFAEVEDYKTKKDKLEALFVDESGIVDFVKEVEKIKLEQGVIKKIAFVGQKVIKDRTGNFGTPIVIEMEGAWKQIDESILDINNLDFVFRPVNITVGTTEEEGVIAFKYGGFLYVDDRLGKN